MRLKITRQNRAPSIHMIWGPFVILFLLTVYIYKDFAGLVPRCVFHKIAGIPCLTCGATRSVVSLAEFHFAASIFFNPLVPVFLLGLVGFSALAAVESALGRKLKLDLSQTEKRGIRAAVICLILVNWTYLILAGI